MKIAVYPGSFDPVTNGHLDVIKRALPLFDQIVVGVARRQEKHPFFTLEERVRLARQATAKLADVSVEGFEGLLIDFARRHKACAMIRGLRAVADFDYEFQMAMTNRKLDPSIEIVYFMPSENFFYVSSSLVKEIARAGGSVDCFVPPAVSRALKAKLAPARR